MMSVLRRLALIVGLTGLAACVAPPRAEPCDVPEACMMSQLVAQDLAADIGVDFGGGITLINAQAAGSLIVVDLEIPIAVAPLQDVQKRVVHEVNTNAFVAGFCDPSLGQSTRDVFMFGNAFQVRTFGNDGSLAGASTIRSCGA